MSDSYIDVRPCPSRHGSLGPCDLEAGHEGPHHLDYSAPFYAQGSYVAEWTDEQVTARRERLARLGHEGILAEAYSRGASTMPAPIEPEVG